jgi:hypothetical protein
MAGDLVEVCYTDEETLEECTPDDSTATGAGALGNSIPAPRYAELLCLVAIMM